MSSAEAAAAPVRRIGLLGGTFDPVHNAHVALAESAQTALGLDSVLWLPAGQPWQKSRAITPAEHRAAMVELAIVGQSTWRVDRREMERAGPSYTLDTVRELNAEHSGTQWHLIVGQDQYAGLHTWLGWQELLSLVQLAVANRPGASLAVNPAVHAQGHTVVPLSMLDIAATDIRARVAGGQDIATLVPEAVARYIDFHRLYRGTPRS